VSGKNYITLSKPGIVGANAITAAAGFFIGASVPPAWGALFAMLVGLSCVIASACALNNYFDRELDSRMPRTRARQATLARIGTRNIFIYATTLLLLGAFTLYHFTNTLALGAALAGFVVYVALYTPLKPKTAHAVYVGAVAGAMPPVVGYTAVSNELNLTALILFLLLYLWQIPHFFAIARYRFEEYEAAGIPLLIEKPKTEKARRRARKIFFATLVVLLFACSTALLWRFIF
jgi:protoheme IX farnesyltransferase